VGTSNGDRPRGPVVDFDHHSPEFNADPVAAWRGLRQQCPVAWSEHYNGYWIVSDYEGNHETLKNWGVFSSARIPSNSGDQGIVIPGGPMDSGVIVYPEELDPPEHTSVRQLLNQQLSPTASRALQPRIEHWTRLCIDAVIEDGECDLLYAVTGPVPAYVTLEWLGYPLDKALEAGAIIHDLLGYPPTSDRWLAALENVGKIQAILAETIAARRKEPRNDAISWFLTREIDGEPVDDDTLVALGIVLVGGGVDTTTGLTSSALVHMNRDHELRRRVVEEPGFLEAATEEFLRMYPPLSSVARTANQDVELRGCPIQKGDRVLVSRHAANFDENEFEEPETFVPDRFPNRHVSFGLGPHRCPGSHLARLMFQEMVRQVLTRMPDYEIDEERLLPYPDRGATTGWACLPARFTPGARSGAPA
jgi:cytochrome P450